MGVRMRVRVIDLWGKQAETISGKTGIISGIQITNYLPRFKVGREWRGKTKLKYIIINGVQLDAKQLEFDLMVDFVEKDRHNQRSPREGPEWRIA